MTNVLAPSPTKVVRTYIGLIIPSPLGLYILAMYSIMSSSLPASLFAL